MGKVVTAITGAVMIGVGIATGNLALIAQGIMTVAAVLLAPSMKARTANKNTLQIGEVAREGMFGEGSTGGSLVDTFNYGGKYGTEWTVMVVALADHLCDGLTGFYVTDKYVPFTGNGLVAGYKNQLRVHFCPGAWDDEVPAWVLDNCPVVDGVPTWTANDRGRGVCKVYVAWKADKDDAKKPVWTSGSPWSSFRWILKGLRCYSARKDSTVGGSGAHRWDDPSTREWTDNPIDCRYTWARGIYAGDHVDDPAMLLLGRGLSAVEAPPENVFAPANLCDEPVALKAGGTEPRYRIGGVFGGDDKYIDTDDDIASACGGYAVEREGAIEIVPGSAQPVVWDITDADLVVGSSVTSSDFRTQTDDEWVNTVAAKYIEPTQQWKDHSAPVRRDTADILADGEPKVMQPSLTLCTSGTQAQRVAEQKRRMGRLWRTRGLTLPPRLVGAEHGDWLRWTSRRYGVRPIPDEPVSIIYRIESDAQDKGWQNQISLREIGPDVYAWSIADELDDGSAAIDNPDPDFSGAPDVGDWTVTGEFVGGNGAAAPALRIVGAADTDAVSSILFDYAAGTVAPDGADDSAWISGGSATGSATEMLITGVQPDTTYWVAVSYMIGAERTDRLILGPVRVETSAMVPAAPTLLTLVSKTTDTATISARTPEYAPFRYMVFFAGSTSNFADAVPFTGQMIASLGAVQSAQELAIVSGQRYYWAVAYSAFGVASAPTGPLSVNLGGFSFASASMPSGAALTRSSSASRINSSGNLVTESADVARITYDRTSHALLGLLIEAAGANELPNNTMVGATTGVIGSGGAVPTGWTTPTAMGLTREIVGVGQVNGIDYIDVRFYGTTTSTAVLGFALEPAASAAVGSIWTNAAYLALVGGSLANVSNMQLRAGGEAGPTLLNSVLNGTLTRYTNTRTLTATSPICTLRWNYASVGAAVDFTLRIGLPQRQSGSKATSSIKTSGSAVTRAADILSLDWWMDRHVPDGTITLRYTFDDGSTQDVSTTIASGHSTVPTSLNRSIIMKVERV